VSPEVWLEIALAELADHVAEVPGVGNNARIVEYHAATKLKATDDLTPWCSSFICWVMEQAGIPSTKSAMARSWLSWVAGGALQLPRFGAITVLQRGEPGSNQGHVGFLVASRGNRVALVAGNQNNRVSIEWAAEGRVIGYRWPLGVP